MCSDQKIIWKTFVWCSPFKYLPAVEECFQVHRSSARTWWSSRSPMRASMLSRRRNSSSSTRLSSAGKSSTRPSEPAGNRKLNDLKRQKLSADELMSMDETGAELEPRRLDREPSKQHRKWAGIRRGADTTRNIRRRKSIPLSCSWRACSAMAHAKSWRRSASRNRSHRRSK